MSDDYTVEESAGFSEMPENSEKSEVAIVYGKVVSVASFGAFLRLDDGSQGMVHISELSDSFIKDINEFVFKGQRLPAVIIGTEHDGRKRLSVKKASAFLAAEGKEGAKLGNPDYSPDAKMPGNAREGRNSVNTKGKQKEKEENRAKREICAPPPMYDELDKKESTRFEDKLAKYIKDSGERLTDIKKQTEGKRGGGYVRRG